MRGRAILRVVVGIAGAYLMTLVVQGTALVVFFSLLAAQSPDPLEPDPHPDSWGEAARWMAVPVGLAAVVALVAGVAFGLLFWAIRGHCLRARQVAGVAVGAMIALVAPNAVLLAVRLAAGE